MTQLKPNSTSAKLSLVGGILGLATLAAFTVYGIVYDYFDIVVFLTIALGSICAIGYVCLNTRAAELLNLMSVVFVTFGLGLFFLNSHPVWADRLNNITMYGSRGTLFPVISIMAMCFVVIFLEIASCFTRKENG